MLASADDEVWKALADPTRRQIVADLVSTPRTTGDLVERFSPTLVRTAVMKHLDVLEEAGLIHIERVGRSRWNRLEKKPLIRVSTWLQRRVLTHQGNLQRLKNLAETTATNPAAKGSSHRKQNKDP